MSSEPIGAGAVAGKAAGLVAKPLFAAVRKELAKRGAGDVSASSPASIDAALDAAIDVLSGDAETAFGQPKLWLKGALSAPPVILTDEDARYWLARGDVRAVVKQATVASIANHLVYTERGDRMRQRKLIT